MLIDNKLLLFGGKGGVGKTSCAAATALYAASKGKKTLVLSTDPAHSLSDSFNKPIGGKITKLGNNLDALEIDTATLLRDYKEKYSPLLRQIADEGTFFSKDEIQRFFDLSLPGMDELMALIKIIDILEEDKYDLMILDTAPTGHTIRLLELPELMTSYVKVLIEMRQKHKTVISMISKRYVKDKADEYIEKTNEDIKRIKSILKDATKTKFIPITIPEAMSVYETEKLVSVLEKHQIPIEMIIINRTMNENCDFCKTKKLDQEKYVKEIKEKFSRYETKEVPSFPNEIREKSLGALSSVLFDAKYMPPKPQIKKLPATNLKFESLKIRPDLDFLLLGGKGGVGKTTMASAIALEESRKRKVLIFSADPAHSLSDSFNIEIGDNITKINDNLDALETNANKLLIRLKSQYKREIQKFFKSIFKPTATATIDAPYDRRVMEDLFELAPPGVDEIMTLKTMMDLMEEKKYDLFILDTAPSGHAIRLLEMPEIAEEWIATLSGIIEQYPISLEAGETLSEMLETIKQVRNILADKKKTEFIVVTIPEAMSLLETQDLVSSLKKLKVPTSYLIINKIMPENKCAFCRTKRAEQDGYIGKLRELKLKTVGVELFDREIRGMETLNKLSARLYGVKQKND